MIAKTIEKNEMKKIQQTKMKQMVRVDRGKKAIKDMLMNWSFAVQPGD